LGYPLRRTSLTRAEQSRVSEALCAYVASKL
jgi:hypothetical protein